MNYQHSKLVAITLLGIFLLSSCTMAKLEARLEANPQCKDVVNTKTGSVMPCPGTDRAFYRSVGLEPAKPVTSAIAITASNTVNNPVDQKEEASFSQKATTPAATIPKPDCKPQIHKKSGSMIPCPPLE